MRPGISVRPLRSTRSAPCGTVTLVAGPTCTIFPSRTITVPRSMTLPVPSITRPPTNAVVCAAAGTAAQRSAQRAEVRRLRSFMRQRVSSTSMSDLRVLVADDDPVSRTVVAAILRKGGYKVQLANDGAQAWAVLQQPDPPAMAVMDW